MAPRPEATLFSFIDQIRDKADRYEYNPKIASPYMLLLGLSNNNKDLKVCNEVNKLLWSLPPEMVYTYFFEAIPKGKVWAKWPSSKKDKTLEKEIKEIMEKYNVSKYEATILLGE